MSNDACEVHHHEHVVYGSPKAPGSGGGSKSLDGSEVYGSDGSSPKGKKSILGAKKSVEKKADEIQRQREAEAKRQAQERQKKAVLGAGVCFALLVVGLLVMGAIYMASSSGWDDGGSSSSS